jgi:hypothetical protein
MQQHPFQVVTIVRATAHTDLPELGIKQGDTFYLAHNGQPQNFRVVKWDRVRWVCSCGKGACEHKLAVNELVLKELQKCQITGDDLVAHVEDEAQFNG